MRLFDLIHSLTPQQLIYIKKRFKDDGSHHNLTLINLIKEQTEPNIEEIIKKTGWSKKHTNSLAYKGISDILRVLRMYQTNPIIEARIIEHIQNIRILNELKQYKLAKREIKRIAYLYKKHNIDFLINEVRTWELKTAIKKANSGYKLEDEQLINDLGNISQHKKSKATYWELLLKTIDILRHNPFTNKVSKYNLDDIIKHPFVKDINNATSTEQKALHFYINGLSQQIQGNSKKALGYVLKMIEELESNKALINLDSSLYISALNDVCFMYMKLSDNNGGKVKIYAQKLKEAPRTDISSEKEILKRYYPIQFLHLSQQKEDAKLIEVIREFEKARKKYKDIVLPEYFAIAAATVLIYAKAYNMTIDYITPILKTSSSKIRQPRFVAIAKMFFLICQYSIGETKFVERLTPKTRNFLNKKGFNDDVNKMLLCFFSKADNHASKKEALKTLQSKIQDYKKTEGNKGLLIYLDVSRWLKEMLNH